MSNEIGIWDRQLRPHFWWLRRLSIVHTLARQYRRLRLRIAGVQVYNQDGLRTIHDHTFMKDPAFRRAYRRGVASARADHHWHWRVHVGLWAANHAKSLAGDFVECGVSSGFLSSAIMTAIDWNALDRTFYLLDTFRGIDERYVSEAEKDNGIMRHSARNITSGLYAVDVDAVRQNFSEWHRTRIIVGSVPETLAQVDAQRIAFLHLDLNCAIPEARALNHFWDRLTPGALVLMDDYAYHGASVQKALLDEVAHSKGVSIVALPTGQGLLIKPPDAGRKNLVIDRQDGAPH